MVSNKNYFNAVFQAGTIWALCITIIEIFQITTSASVRFLAPLDVLSITAGFFVSYLVLWVIFLYIVAFIIKIFWKERNGTNANVALLFWCIAFFSYEFFWVLYKLMSEKLYASVYGIFLTLILLICAMLIVYAIYQIILGLVQKGHLKQLGSKVTIIGISLIVYLTTFIYVKSLTKDGHLGIFYSILLLSSFLVLTILIFLFFNRFGSTFKNVNHKFSKGKTKSIHILTILFAAITVLTGTVISIKAKINTDASSKPNVILISIDTLRADHVSIYGENKKETTPNIDRIAKDGYTFIKSYSTSSWTLPSHASMFTGLFPSSHGADRSFDQSVNHPVDPLPQSMVTIAEVLKENNYLTAGFISVPYLSSSFGMNQGFQYYDEKIDLFNNVLFVYANQYSMLFKLLQYVKIIESDDFDSDRGAPDINEKALRWLENNKDKEHPFFLFLHYFEPHYIYKPPKPYNMSDDGRNLEYFTEIEKLNNGQFSLSSYGLKDLITLYDGEISYLDYQLGLLFKRIDRWNLMENTLLIITSDHGESFNEHEVWTHGNRLYEEQIRVPLIIHFPKLVHSGRVDSNHIVQNIDLMPSILDITGIPIPKNIQGRSLLPILKGQQDATFNFAFAELRPDINWKGKNQRFGEGIKAVINKEWKYLKYDSGREELFNLDTDPKEEKNLAASNLEKVGEMKKALDLWSDSVARKKDQKQDIIDGGRLEQLRSLGYIK